MRRLERAGGGMDYTVGVRVDAMFTNSVFAVEKHLGVLGKPQVQAPPCVLGFCTRDEGVLLYPLFHTLDQ